MSVIQYNPKFRKSVLAVIAATTVSLFSSTTVMAADMSNNADNFYQSSQVTIKKVTFKNQYNMNVVGNLVIPKNLNKNTKAPAIIVGHPMGAVKEQSSMLYAQKLAEQKAAAGSSGWSRVCRAIHTDRDRTDHPARGQRHSKCGAYAQ